MVWSRVVWHYARLDQPTDMLVLHVGGNDLGVRPIGELMLAIKADFMTLCLAFPGMLIVWSDMVVRTAWRMTRSVERVNKSSIKVNKVVGRFVSRNGGLVIRHAELEVNVGFFITGGMGALICGR